MIRSRSTRGPFFCGVFLVLVLLCSGGPVAGFQETAGPSQTKKAEDKKDEKKEDAKPEAANKLDRPPKADKNQTKPGKPETWSAETLAEIVIYYSGSRPVLDYVGTNGVQEGVIRLAAGDGTPPIEGKFTRRFLRKESSDRDNIRIDVELPRKTYTFGFNGLSSWAAEDGVPFKPAPEAETSFLASLVHDYNALLRYKEDGTTIERAGTERIMGIDTLLIDLTHKDGTKTRYYISNKSFHILHLEYEVALLPNAKPTKFRESFYEFRFVQGVLTPAKTVLSENDKFVQEIELKEMRFRLAKLDEELFLKY